MPRVTKKCKVCGKEYECCRTPNLTGVFRWVDVACCKEHGEEFLRQLLGAGDAKAEADSEQKKES